MTDTKIFRFTVPSKYVPYAAAFFAAAAGFALPVSGIWYESHYGHVKVPVVRVTQAARRVPVPVPVTVTATRDVQGPVVAVPGPVVHVTATATVARTVYATAPAVTVTATSVVTQPAPVVTVTVTQAPPSVPSAGSGAP